MRGQLGDRFLQMLKASRADEQEHLGVAEHSGRIREHFRLLPDLIAKSRTIGALAAATYLEQHGGEYAAPGFATNSFTLPAHPRI
jgi:hypothetical protein